MKIVKQASVTMLSRAAIASIAIWLAACGGGSGGGASTQIGTPVSPPPSAAKNLLFVSDGSHQLIAGVNTLNPAAGASLAINVLASPLLAGPGMAYDTQRDVLYATAGESYRPNTIVAFERAASLSGNITPSRTITPVIDLAPTITGLIYDKEHDALYVNASGRVAVFNAVSQKSGSVKPDRLITGVEPGYFAIDFKRAILYTQNDTTRGPLIFAYPNIDTLTGAAPQSTRKMINFDQPGGRVEGIAVDAANDRVYFGLNEVGIGILENASKAGAPFGTPGAFDRYKTPVLNVPVQSPSGYDMNIVLAFDPVNDRLYAGAGKTAVILNGVSKLGASGQATNAVATSAPDGTIIAGFALPQ